MTDELPLPEPKPHIIANFGRAEYTADDMRADAIRQGKGPTMTHGGRRRRHTPPTLTPEQVQRVREARAQGVPFKVLARTYQVSRWTLHRAASGTRTYQGYPSGT
jgi:DNA-binding transcriptional regulator YiaG